MDFFALYSPFSSNFTKASLDSIEKHENNFGKLCMKMGESFPLAYAGFFNGGVSVTSHRDDVCFCDVTAIIMP